MREALKGYPDRRDDQWARDYTSIEAYLSVVEVNREDWSNVIGECGPETTDLAPWMEPFMRWSR